VKPVGLLVAFAGYVLGYFGWCSIRGPGVGLVDLVVPGRFDAKHLTIPGGSSAAGGWVGPPQTGTNAINKIPASTWAKFPKSLQAKLLAAGSGPA
jgi:hypothetical protein